MLLYVLCIRTACCKDDLGLESNCPAYVSIDHVICHMHTARTFILHQYNCSASWEPGGAQPQDIPLLDLTISLFSTLLRTQLFRYIDTAALLQSSCHLQVLEE